MIGSKAVLVERLRGVSYYRLSGYWYPFRKPNPLKAGSPLGDFKAGTPFDEVWARYVFDRHLRLVVMDAIERIEIVVRSQLATAHAQRHDSFAYANDPKAMPSLAWAEWVGFLSTVRMEQERSKDVFVKHFKAKYGQDEAVLPLWMAAEVMSFGTLLTCYRGVHQDVRDDLAKRFGVHDTVFSTWLLSLNTVRNICAHHGRLWNREFGTKPKIPIKQPEWITPVAVSGDRIFGMLTICKWCLDRVAPQSGWSGRLQALLDEYPTVPSLSMGFPANWKHCPIWK